MKTKVINILSMLLYFVEGIGPRTTSRGASSVDSPAASNAVGTGKATLRLKSKGPPVVETQEVGVTKCIFQQGFVSHILSNNDTE